MMNYFVASILMCLNAFALESLKIQDGRYLAIEKNILDTKKPTLIFLPGINRGLDSRDAFMKLAKKANLNFVSFHFSLHPESVFLVPNNEVAYFKYHSFNAKDLADEVNAVILNFKIKKPIIVGLSYSSIVTTELAARSNLPMIVETAPMMRFDEGDPSGSQVTTFWRDYFSAIPFAGGIWKEAFLQQVYQQYWFKQIDSILENYPKAKESFSIRSDLVSAYAKLSVAADGFDFSSQDYSTGTKRLFILGKNEMPLRYELQLKAISAYEAATGDEKTTVILAEAGHIVPSDAPQAYLNAIKDALKIYIAITK